MKIGIKEYKNTKQDQLDLRKTFETIFFSNIPSFPFLELFKASRLPKAW